MKPLPPVDVRMMTCGMLNSASDDDKAYAATFLLGYRSGLTHVHILDTKKIDAVETAAMAACAARPDAIASRVFAQAQIAVDIGAAPRLRPGRVHRRAMPAAAPEPPEAPPMRYAPAQGMPAVEAPAEPSPSSPAENSPAAPSPSEAPRQ